jgi:hypothetical protein
MPEKRIMPIANSGNQGGIRMWPSEDWASRLYDLANWSLLAALVVGAASTALLVWMGNVKEEYLKRDLAATNERAAHAEERAAQASLELAKFKTPRNLSPEQQTRISEKLKAFAGKQFDVALILEPEPEGLLPQIEDALKSAGWLELDWEGPEIVYKRGSRPSAGIITESGVIIQMHPERVTVLSPAAQALASALDAEGVSAKAEPGLGVINTNSKAIHILIGKKPL